MQQGIAAGMAVALLVPGPRSGEDPSGARADQRGNQVHEGGALNRLSQS